MYFPNCSIFKAKVSSGSFAWKSILKARKVITMGPKWHVSDGLSIQIYGDKCLPSEQGGRVLSPLAELPIHSMVSDLFDQAIGG